MDKELVKKQYESLSVEELKKEHAVRVADREKILKDHEQASDDQTKAIVKVAFGVVFIWFLPTSIPLLVIGIPATVDASKRRNRANIAYHEANWRISLLETLLAGKGEKPGVEEVSGEVVG